MSYQVVPPNHPVEAVLSLEQGLLLPANRLGKFIIESAMSRAQELHPIKLSDYVVEGSHIHFAMFVEDPSTLTGFVERFKTESAHYINAMLGRRKRTVWCEGFSKTPILTLSRMIEKLVYIYTNPAKDALVDSIEEYPGATSWRAFCGGSRSRRYPRLHRPMIPYLPGRAYSLYEYKKQIKLLKKMATSSQVLELTPEAWMPFFGITTEEEQRQIRDEVIARVREREEQYRRERLREGKTVIGAGKLMLAHLEPDYMPERTGKKMWCLCDNTELRVSYIAWAKEIKKRAREVYERWKQGDFSVSYPPGVFPPAVPKLANMTSLACDY